MISAAAKKRRAGPKRMSETTYLRHEDELNGICCACGAIRHGNTEGDAEGYECGRCGMHSVVGIQNALIMGLIDIRGGK
jgi:hypothetical protein